MRFHLMFPGLQLQHRKPIRTLAPLLLFAASVVASPAQVTTADILGQITDANGALLPNAKVTVKNLGTGETRVSTTDQNGGYTFSLLGIGRYTVNVELSGFKQFAVSSVNLAAGDRFRVDAHLQLGQVTETIDVQATAPALQSDSSALAATITEKAVEDLPLNGRNFVNVAQLVPGATAGPTDGLSGGNRLTIAA